LRRSEQAAEKAGLDKERRTNWRHLNRRRESSRPGEFVLIDTITRHRLDGPFTSLRDAAEAARTLRTGATLWCEFFDSRGRAFGQPIRLELNRL
jgi:hypothetical protein